jgi:hypothetical protein
MQFKEIKMQLLILPPPIFVIILNIIAIFGDYFTYQFCGFNCNHLCYLRFILIKSNRSPPLKDINRTR